MKIHNCSDKLSMNVLKFIKILKYSISILVLLSLSHFAQAAGVGYHGRLLRSDSSPVNGQFVGFRIRVMDGVGGTCEMYQETRTIDMRTSNGAFSITVGDGVVAGTFNVSSVPFFDELFQNDRTFNFTTGACTGVPYVAGTKDGRKLFVQFRETPASPWEDLPIMNIAHVPFSYSSLVSKKVGLHESGSLLRVENGGVPSAATALTPADFTELVKLLNGTTSQYVKSVVGTAGEVNVVSASGTATVSLPTIGTLTPGTYGSATQVPVFVVDAKGRITGVTNTTITGGGGGGITDLTGDVTASGTGSVAATIAANAVTTAKILDANVTANKLAADSVTTAKILNGNVTDTKLASDSVTTAKILDANVTLNKLASDSVNSAKIVDGSITGADISGTAALSVASVAATGNVGAGTMSTRSLGFFELPVNGINNISFQAPDNLAGNTTYILPAADGGVNQVLKTDGAGNLSWQNDATGGSPSDASYAAKGVVQFDTDAATSGMSVTAGVVKIATGGVSTGMIANDAVNFSKMQNIATNKLLGRGTALSGDVEEITLGTGLSLSGTTLNATGTDTLGGLSCASGDVARWTGAAWACRAATAANTADTLMYRDSSGNFLAGTGQFSTSVKITDGAAGGQVTIAAPSTFTSYNLTLPSDDGAPNQVLQTNGTGTLTWANQTAAGLSAVTNTANLADAKIWIGDSGGKAQEFLMSGDVTMTNGGAVAIANNAVTTAKVADDAITFSKIQNITDARIIGRSAGSAGDAQEITVGSGLSLAGGTLTATGISVGDATYAAKGVVQLDTDAATSGIAVTSGVIKLANSGVAANTYGAAATVPVFTVDAFGRVTSVTDTAIALNASAITAGILPIARGGTNSGTALNNNRMMVSSGGAIVEAAALTNGQILIGSTGAAPVAASLTAGSGITITPSAGGISIAATATAPGDASYAAKGIVQFDTDLATSGITVASGVAKIGTGGVSSGMIANDAVTFSKIQNITDARLIGRSAGSAGDAQEITVGSGLSLAGGTLTATGISVGDATYAAKGVVQLDTDAATSGIVITSGVIKLANSGVTANTYGSASSVPAVTVDAFGRVTSVTDTAIALNASAITAGILPIARGGTNSGTALNNNRLMVSSGGAIVEAPALTNGQLLIGSTGAAPVAANLTAGSGITITPSAGGISIAATATAPGDASYAAKGIVQFDTDLATSGITVASGVAKIGAGGVSTGMIAADAVTFAKTQNIATNKLLGRGTAGSGDIEELTLGTGLSLSGTTLNASGIAAVTNTANLADTKIWIGDSGGKAQEFALSGDATMTAGGVVTVDATAANTASKIVKRDASGNFVAGTGQFSTAVKITDGAAGGQVTISAPGTFTSYNLTLPVDDGTPNQVLQTNGTGVLSWTTPGSPGDASYAAKGVVQLDTNAATSGLSIASGVMKLATSGVAANTYGAAATIPVFTVDAFGRVTSVTDTAIALNASAITAGILPIARGGTNSGTVLNNNRLMVSSGGAIVEAAALTNGQILIGSTGAAPVAASLTAGSGITITPSAGGISIAATATAPGDASYAAKGIVQFDTDLATSGITVASGVAKIGTGGVSTGMLADDAVTFSKFQNITDNKILGRSAGSSGDMQEITIGTGLSMSAGTLSATATAPGDASYAAKGIVQFDTDLATSGITVASGVAKIGTGGVSTAMVANDAVTYAKMQNVTATQRLLGRYTAAAGDMEEISLGAGLTLSGAGVLDITDGTDNDILGGMSCSTGDVGYWNGAAWVCKGTASANTASTLMARDASGNFVAGTGTFNTSVKVTDGAAGGQVTISAPGTFTSYNLILPTTDGDPDQVLKTNGSGVLSWASTSSGGGLQAGVTATVTIGAACTTGGELATDGSGNLIVCADTPSDLQGTDCSTFNAGAMTLDPTGAMYVCRN